MNSGPRLFQGLTVSMIDTWEYQCISQIFISKLTVPFISAILGTTKSDQKMKLSFLEITTSFFKPFFFNCHCLPHSVNSRFHLLQWSSEKGILMRFFSVHSCSILIQHLTPWQEGKGVDIHDARHRSKEGMQYHLILLIWHLHDMCKSPEAKDDENKLISKCPEKIRRSGEKGALYYDSV